MNSEINENAEDSDIISLSGGDIMIWIENDSSLHLKSITKQNDPVELNCEELVELCEILQKLVKRIH